MNPVTEYVLSNLKLDGVKEYAIEKSKDNKNIIRIFKDDKYVYLGSKYSIDRDINKLLEELKDINNETIIIIFGLGTGEHILKILNNTEYNKIIVFEPNLSVIKTFLNIDYCREILDNDRLIFGFYEKNICKDIINNLIRETEANNVKVLSYANYSEIFSREFNDFLKICIDVVEKCLINISTEICFSRKMIEVYLNNLKNMIQSTPINYYKNAAKGMPAIVVSAGPSLSKNIHKLRQVQDKFVIICGARTLKPLLDIGVNPDFICIVDPGDVSFQFIKECKCCDATMVFCEISNCKTVNFYKGIKTVFREGSIFRDLTYELTKHNISSLWNGGSVAHTCTSFANYLGCNVIIFIGQDLAYTNNKQHDDRADFCGSNNKNIKDDSNNIYVEDIYGGKVLTSKVLNFYRKNFEEYINRTSSIKFINATEGGANIKGTQIMTLEEVINKYGKEATKEIVVSEGFEGFHKSIIISNLKNIDKELEVINKRCKKYLNIIKTMNDKEDTINIKIIKLLNDIKANNEKIEKVSILNSLINPTVNKVVSKPEYRENEKDSDLQKVKKIIEQTKIVYGIVVDSIKYLKPRLEQIIDELERGEKNE